MGYSLGIDFGTSTTKVALRRDRDIPEALPIGSTGDYFMPSVVAYRRAKNDKAEQIAVGEDALAVAETEDTCVLSEIKRCLAVTESVHEMLPCDRYPWWNPQKRVIQLWSDELSPEHVVETILTEALDRAIRRAREIGIGLDIDRHSIRGVPTRLGTSVTASLETRKVLAEVARRLGFPTFRVDDLWEEPILACLSYVHYQVVPGEKVLVYDWGGGTFDTTVIIVHEESSKGVPDLTVFSSGGMPFCGGTDIDDAFFLHVARRIANEYLGFPEEGIEQVLELMTTNETQQLRNQAREAKEELSRTERWTIALPVGFLGEDGITLSVSREELETIIKSTGLIDTTSECVLRAWRRARMLYRKEGEAVGSFYLNMDSSSGHVGGSVLGLDHGDLRETVDRILVVGGTTRIPLVRERLASLWGREKLMSDEVVKPIQACAVGAAWQQQSVGNIVDRLPFSIAVRWDSEERRLYKAFDETINYKTVTDNPSIIPFKSAPFSLPAGRREGSVIYETPDGVTELVEASRDFPPSPCHLEIDMFGNIFLKGHPDLPPIKLENRHQHQLQRELWAKLEATRQQGKQQEIDRAIKYTRRLPGEDPDVG